MGFLKIECGNCGQSWEVYHRDNWSSLQTRQCPHCYAEMTESEWELVIEGFYAMQTANADIERIHEMGRAPSFRVEYRENKRASLLRPYVLV